MLVFMCRCTDMMQCIRHELTCNADLDLHAYAVYITQHMHNTHARSLSYAYMHTWMHAHIHVSMHACKARMHTFMQTSMHVFTHAECVRQSARCMDKTHGDMDTFMHAPKQASIHAIASVACRFMDCTEPRLHCQELLAFTVVDDKLVILGRRLLPTANPQVVVLCGLLVVRARRRVRKRGWWRGNDLGALGTHVVGERLDVRVGLLERLSPTQNA